MIPMRITRITVISTGSETGSIAGDARLIKSESVDPGKCAQVTMPNDDMIEIRNINVPGRTSRINAVKYHAMRTVLLGILPQEAPGLSQAEMCKAVLPHLPQELWPNGEKSKWWVKTVQLDLEARGLVIRDRNAKPTRWRRA